MSIQTVEGFGCGNWQGKPVEIEAVEKNLTRDGGLLVFSQLDEKLGWTTQFAKLIYDPRTAPQQSALSIVRQRVFGIIAGYEDQNDHDTLRTDVQDDGRASSSGHRSRQSTYDFKAGEFCLCNKPVDDAGRVH